MADAPAPTPVADEPPTPAGERRAWVDFSRYTVGDYHPGRGRWTRLAWYAVSLLLFETGLCPPPGPKTWLLRKFGAKIGKGVMLKPGVRIKYPWRLEVGDYSWIGEQVWIDSIVNVRIGSHVCISQDVYFCTGSHDHTRELFDLIPGEIVVDDGAWVAARSTLLPHVTVGANAVVAAGAVVSKDVPPAAIVGGVPAKVIGERQPPTG
ncbi:MAG: WcaF family extracellular polysaccharide biosynthesis acetyltransferase [Planctomycetota bacterium]